VYDEFQVKKLNHEWIKKTKDKKTDNYRS